MSELSVARRPLERALGLVTEVRRPETPAALTLLASVFLILTAYYFIKPAREGWLSVSLVAGLGKTELRAYSSFGQSLLLFGAVAVYDRLVATRPRRRLVTGVHLFFIANLLGFWLLQPGLLTDRVPGVGILFYLWVGIFNVFIVAQFWSFTADFYDPERGRRLVPLVALGASAGAVFGSWLAGTLVQAGWLGTYGLLLAAALPLLGGLLLLRRADRLGPGGVGPRPDTRQPPSAPEGASALGLVRRHRYLAATALLTLLFGWAGSNGENVLFGAVQERLDLGAAAVGEARAREAFVREGTTAFYGDYYLWVNAGALALQALVAARLLRWGGFGPTLLLLPLLTTFGYAAMALFPALAVIKPLKIAENATNYSIHNTARHVLWLPTTPEMKYKAKQAIDTLGVRLGDGLAALTVLIGIGVLSFRPTDLFWMNVPIGLAWLAAGAVVVREHRRITPRARS